MTQITAEQVLACLSFEQTHKSDPWIWSVWSSETPAGVDRYRIVVTVKDTGGIKTVRLSCQSRPGKPSHDPQGRMENDLVIVSTARLQSIPS